MTSFKVTHYGQWRRQGLVRGAWNLMDSNHIESNVGVFAALKWPEKLNSWKSSHSWRHQCLWISNHVFSFPKVPMIQRPKAPTIDVFDYPTVTVRDLGVFFNTNWQQAVNIWATQLLPNARLQACFYHIRRPNYTRRPSWRKGKRATAVRVWRPL